LNFVFLQNFKNGFFSYFLFCFCLTKYQNYSNLASWLDCIRLIEINIKSKLLSLLKDTTCNLYNISIPIYLNYPQNGPQDIRSRPSIVNQGNSHKKTSSQWTMLWLLQGWGYGLLCLTSLSTLFQLYCRGQFYWGGNRSTQRNHQPATSHWQTLSHNVISSIPRNFSDDMHWLHM
jgi:hypothetical protein